MKKLIRMEIQGTNFDLFTHKSVPVIFEPPCISWDLNGALTRFKIGMTMEGKKEYGTYRELFKLYCVL
jgi:hypothetical protein